MAIHHLSITLPPSSRASARGTSGRFGSLPVPTTWPAHLTGMNTQLLGLESFLGVEELAEYLGVPVQTIYDWRLSGTAPRAHRFGKRLKFALTDVQSWIAEHRKADK